MSITNLTPATSKDFLEANKEALVLLIFDGEFTGQQDIVSDVSTALIQSTDLPNKIILAQVDVEQNNDLATEFGVIAAPMIVCVKSGKVVKRIDTLESTKVINIVKEQLQLLELSITNESGEAVDPKTTFKTYLKKLTTRAPVMIFMKGNPQTPRCGFSKQLIELLSKHDIKYETFDILQDDEVRQGLKEYSDWPTYPQIYAKGEFVGGLDILKQMDEAGELKSTLNVS